MKLKKIVKSLLIVAVSAGSSAWAASSGKNFGLRVAPIAAFIGDYVVAADIALGRFVITPEYETFSFSFADNSFNLTGMGGSLNYHFSGALTDSWYLGAMYKQYHSKADSPEESGEQDSSFMGARLGYLWVWDNFYMNLGMYGGSVSDSKIVLTNKATNVKSEEDLKNVSSTGAEFKIGFAF